MKNDVIISGYYGMRNFGDDLFVMCGLAGLNKVGFKPVALSTKINGIPESKCVVKYDDYSATGQSSAVKRFLFKTKNYASYSNVIYCGGSIYSDVGLSRRIQNNLMRIMDIKRGAIGVSIGPFSSVANERKVQQILKTYSFLSLRDKMSFDIASNMNLPYNPVLTTDIASTYEMPNEYKIKLEKTQASQHNIVIGVALCSPKNMSDKEVKLQYDFIRLIYKFLSDIGQIIKVKVFELNGHGNYGDSFINNEFVENLPNNCFFEHIPYISGVNNIMVDISSCDFIFCSRLHAGIMSYISNVPFLLFEYHSKCSDFLDYIGMCHRYDHHGSLHDNLNTVNKAFSAQYQYTVDPLEYRKIAFESFNLAQKTLL